MDIRSFEHSVNANELEFVSRVGYGNHRLESFDVTVLQSRYDSSELIVRVKATVSYRIGDSWAAKQEFKSVFEDIFEEMLSDHDEDGEFESIEYEYSISTYERD